MPTAVSGRILSGAYGANATITQLFLQNDVGFRSKSAVWLVVSACLLIVRWHARNSARFQSWLVCRCRQRNAPAHVYFGARPRDRPPLRLSRVFRRALIVCSVRICGICAENLWLQRSRLTKSAV